MKTAVVSSKKVGTNCWSPERFVSGVCMKVKSCKYPEKKTCLAYRDVQVVTVTMKRINAKEC